uniref:Uncharacterized protein n=1 Tax=Cryptomonas curvata TaxID=233186 RepID=A0A7S0MZH5_9CRYP|mmetsp:Transcript_57442/g.120133  ORF Transcript_57442/g.120133 Transcript_57442/m.120133 type:complete len:103 (+) Transcript_57442:58-366(+)
MYSNLIIADADSPAPSWASQGYTTQVTQNQVHAIEVNHDLNAIEFALRSHYEQAPHYVQAHNLELNEARRFYPAVDWDSRGLLQVYSEILFFLRTDFPILSE